MSSNGIALGVAVLLGVGSTSPHIAPQSASGGSPSANAHVQALRSRGWELAYNLDYPEALATLEEAIALDPSDPALQRLAASVIWMGILFEWGAVLVDDYLGQAKEVIERPKPSPSVDRSFRDHITRALALAERRLRDDERDPDAHFQLGAGCNRKCESILAGAGEPGGTALT
jgi:tetratricopeptide (TPR) repeat protein